MTLWKRRLITAGVVAILLTGMYQKMVVLGWSHRAMAICYGCFSLVAGFIGLCGKRDSKFAELTGLNFSPRSEAVKNAVFALIGAGLLTWAFLWPQNSN